MDDKLLQRIVNRDYVFAAAAMQCRDALRPIIDGEIERGHCSPGTRECYGGKPGRRKTTLKDAQKIARHIVTVLNRALNEFDKSQPKPWD